MFASEDHANSGEGVLMIVGIPILIALSFVFLAYAAIRINHQPAPPVELPPEQPNMTIAHLVDRQWDRTLRAIHELPERTP